VTDINNRGQLVGQTGDAAGQGLGFVRDPDGKLTIIELPGPAGVQEVLALNDRGQVTGTWDDRPEPPAIEPGSRHGFVWDRGRLTRFDVPGSLATAAFGINNAGQITGVYADATGGRHGFLLDRGRYRRSMRPAARPTTGVAGANTGDRPAQDEETTMGSIIRIHLRRRLRLAVAGAVVVTALTAATAGASAPPVETPAPHPTRLAPAPAPAPPPGRAPPPLPAGPAPTPGRADSFPGSCSTGAATPPSRRETLTCSCSPAASTTAE
jgi:hypothetical protein